MGSSGLIGTKVVDRLTADSHAVTAASRRSGVNLLTGEGLGDAQTGADVLVDGTNSPSFADGPVLDFFTAFTTNQVAVREAGVGHVIVLSIVGGHCLPESGYLRAKVAQEKQLTASPAVLDRPRHAVRGVPSVIIESMTDGDTVRVPDALIQPIAANDVAAEVVRVALGAPLDRVEDIGGPEKVSFAEFARR